MRPIDNRQLRRVTKLATLQASNETITTLSEEDRQAFMEDHQAECSAMRHPLWIVGFTKCWYSEAPLQEPEGHVEHYRPRRRLSGAGHGGYWWRAFDWRNLRLAHATVNRRKTDYLTGKRAGKGSYFPLRHENRRATNLAEETNEEPVLLDPTVPSDTLLISFSEASGAPRPRYSKDHDEWLYRRAEESIEYYHLDEASWNAKRADLMAEVRTLCDQLEKFALQEPRHAYSYNEKIDQIVDYIGPFAEFSAACLQVVRDRGLLEHFATGLL